MDTVNGIKFETIALGRALCFLFPAVKADLQLTIRPEIRMGRQVGRPRDKWSMQGCIFSMWVPFLGYCDVTLIRRHPEQAWTVTAAVAVAATCDGLLLYSRLLVVRFAGKKVPNQPTW